MCLVFPRSWQSRKRCASVGNEGMERPNRYKRPIDKDARLMKTRRGIVPGYNAQAVVSPLATMME